MRQIGMVSWGWVFVAMLLALTGSANAQQESELQGGVKAPSYESVRKKVMKADDLAGKVGQKKEAVTLPKIWCADVDDNETKRKCWAAYRIYLDYFQFGLAHRKAVIRWQHFSTKMIFFVVLTLVALGMYFAYVQFHAEQRRIEEGVGRASGPSSLELAPTGFKISSPVLGVIILGLSLAFFYLYLVYVYPIVEIV